MQVLGVQDFPHLFPSTATGTVKLVQILVDALFIKADCPRFLGCVSSPYFKDQRWGVVEQGRRVG